MHASYINNNDNYTGNNNGNGNEKDNDNNMSTLTWFLFGELKTLWPIFVRNCPFCTIWWKSVGKLNKGSRKKSFFWDKWPKLLNPPTPQIWDSKTSLNHRFGTFNMNLPKISTKMGFGPSHPTQHNLVHLSQIKPFFFLRRQLPKKEKSKFGRPLVSLNTCGPLERRANVFLVWTHRHQKIQNIM